MKRIAVLNPAKVEDKTVTLLIITTLSRDTALVIGFSTLDNGLMDVQDPWCTVAAASKISHTKVPSVAQCNMTLLALSQPSEVIIDQLKVRVEIVQQAWWLKTSRNVLISFEQLEPLPHMISTQRYSPNYKTLSTPVAPEVQQFQPLNELLACMKSGVNGSTTYSCISLRARAETGDNHCQKFDLKSRHGIV